MLHFELPFRTWQGLLLPLSSDFGFIPFIICPVCGLCSVAAVRCFLHSQTTTPRNSASSFSTGSDNCVVQVLIEVQLIWKVSLWIQIPPIRNGSLSWCISLVAPLAIVPSKFCLWGQVSLGRKWEVAGRVWHLSPVFVIHSKPCPSLPFLSTHELGIIFKMAELRRDVVSTVGNPTISVAIYTHQIGIITTSVQRWSDWAYSLGACDCRWPGMRLGLGRGTVIHDSCETVDSSCT